MFDAMEYNSWDDADKMAFMAYELYENGQMNMALSQLEEAIEINPNNSAWYFNAGLTLDAMERYDEAIDAYQQALGISGDDPEILNSLAVDYTRIGQYDLAISIFEHIQQLDPGFEPCYCNRIITYTEMNLHEQAEHMFYLAQQINPDCPICFYNIGNSLFSRQQYERAIWCWERTALLEHTHPQINYRIAQAYWASGNFKKARNHFLAELRNNPGDLDVILDFGIFLLKTGDIEGAREKFNRILELNPDFAPAVFYLGELLLNTGERLKAVDFFTLSLEKDPEIAGPRFRLAQLAFENKNKDDTLSFLRAELELNVEDPDILLSMGTMLLKLGEADSATDCFLKVIDEDRTNAFAFYLLGVALIMRNEYVGAIQFFEYAQSLGLDDPQAQIYVALLYLETSQLTLASKAVSCAIENYGLKPSLVLLKLRIWAAKFFRNIKNFTSSSTFILNLRLKIAKLKCKSRRKFRRYRKGL